jgi:response regulator RpfG family c-di-GMP phosphodiesterase
MATESVLIVDDEPKICQFLEILLKREGYRPTSVNNASDALERIAGDDFDLVLTDLKMPGMDGFQLVTQLKELRPGLPIIMITGYATVETAVQAMRYGVDDYVTKPFNIDELHKVIARALQSARMERENKELLGSLQSANAELARHRALLAARVKKTDSELSVTRGLLNHHKEQAAVFNQITELASGERDLRRLLSGLTEILHKRFGALESCAMIRDGNELEIRAGEGEAFGKQLGRRCSLRDGVAGRVAVDQTAQLLEGDETVRLCGKGTETTGPFTSAMCVPIVNHGRAIGVINLCGRKQGAFTDEAVEFVTAIATQVAPAIENAALYRSLEQRCVSMMQAMVSMVEARDRFSSGHSRRVRDYACSLARAAGVSPFDVDLMGRAAPLHDIGKLGISDQILDKPSKLGEDELHLVQRHPIAGESLLEPLDFLQEARRVIRHHHERVDGGGYPDRLSGRKIPLLSRMLTIADAYDAMTTDRPYRQAMSAVQALGELKACAGTQFDRELVGLFCEKVVSR